MLNKPPLDELLPKTENRYTLAVLVAKRARQLVDGAQPMVENETPNLVTLASEEIVESTVVGVPGEHQPVVPIRPEIEAARLAAERDADNDMTFDLLQQVQQVAAEPQVEEPAPRQSLIKILGDDGEIYEQDDLNEDGTVKESVRLAQEAAAEEAKAEDDEDFVADADDEEEEA